MQQSPLIRRPEGSCALLPPQLFGSVGYYRVVAEFPAVCVDNAMRYDKRFKSVHRFEIADASGPLRLTVPVSRPEGAFERGNLRWQDVLVSAHGRWWEVIPTALESAYGRTPFFEFYIDRLMPLFAPRPLEGTEMITDLCGRADRAVRSILGFDAPIVAADSLDNYIVEDFRRADFGALCPARPYWQVRADRFGFRPGLSVLDLIFNLGPEAPLYFVGE